ncbi:hypothetical protein [Actinoallomurus sp. CA-150999]|uniref:hypothetical protein n=1 Tax=Actinoallomurus sp. CA-150999 TaxID=3239887 RepID=UPI003D9062A6
MKPRHRLRTAVVGAAVAAASLTTVAAAPAMPAQAASCGKQVLGPIHKLSSDLGQVGIYYLAWNSCNYTIDGVPGHNAYTEAHITSSVYGFTMDGYIYVTNGTSTSSGSGTVTAPVEAPDGTYWWDSQPLSIYSAPSNVRTYHGYLEIHDYGTFDYLCSADTPTWSFSGGVTNPGSGDVNFC